MTYYIDGKKVRTSERVYTHAVMIDGELVGCCGSEELARKSLGTQVNQWLSNAKFNRDCAAALDAGKTHIRITERTRRGPYSWNHKLDRSKEEYLARAEEAEARAKGFYIVELEAR